jgi:hypothetical protein
MPRLGKTKTAGWHRSARTRPFARYNRKMPLPTIRHTHPLDVVCPTFIRTITFRTDPCRAPLNRITLCMLCMPDGKRGALKNPQLQSAVGRRIGHSRLSRSTYNSRERTGISFGVVVGSLSSVSLRTLYRVNRKKCFPGIGLSKF